LNIVLALQKLLSDSTDSTFFKCLDQGKIGAQFADVRLRPRFVRFRRQLRRRSDELHFKKTIKSDANQRRITSAI